MCFVFSFFREGFKVLSSEAFGRAGLPHLNTAAKRREGLKVKMTNLPADLFADGVILMEVSDGMKRHKMERKTRQ